jgi:hypothetical protein
MLKPEGENQAALLPSMRGLMPLACRGRSTSSLSLGNNGSQLPLQCFGHRVPLRLQLLSLLSLLQVLR